MDWPIEQPEIITLPPGWHLFIEGRRSPGSQERYGEDRLIHSLQPLSCAQFNTRIAVGTLSLAS